MKICYVPSILFCILRMLLFLCFILLFTPSPIFAVKLLSHAHLSNISDEKALIGFMSAITTYDNPSRSLRTIWKPNVSVCEWAGVKCSRRRQRVVSLCLMSMELQGTISPLLGNLSFLEVLDLRNNSFHGHIPYQLGSLFRLKMLLLSLNQLQGSIPPTLGGCRSLINFSMSCNHVGGIIPPELCIIPNLQFFDLGSNNLTGAIPACLGNISSLETISLNSNNLHGRVPLELGMLSLLRKFYVWNNSLTGQIPSSFSNCTNLRVLSLGRNNLTGSIPTELCTKHSPLIGLYLHGNQFSGNIPASLFNCTNLQQIVLGRNRLSGVVPMELGKLTELQRLYLNNNQLVSGSATNLPILTTLTNCSSLQVLDLFSNRLTGRLPFSIGQLSTKIAVLYLDHNELRGKIPPQIGNLTNLTYLGLEANSFTGAIPSSLNKLQKLERLYLSANKFQGNIPTGIGQLKSLGLLNIWGNNLSGRIPDSLAHLQQLRYLLLNNNQLSGNIPANLGKCVNLLQLDLSYNRLSGRIPREVAGLANLALYLRLSNNLLQGPVPLELGKMAKVQVIDISANRLTGGIPRALRSCEALEYLNLSRNALKGLIPASLGELQNLQVMDFSSNNLSGGIPESLEKLKMLSHLNFSFNRLSGEVPKGGVFRKLGAKAFVGNVGLCGSWVSLPPCSANKHKSQLERVLISVIAVTAVIVLCLFLGILWRQNHRRLDTVESLKVGHQRISYVELVNATDGFSDSNLLGVGSFGKVYKGVMNDDTLVAVKLLNLENEGANKSFEKECNILSKVRHRNLITIITCYSDLDFKALIFPFMPNGSLEKWLYPSGEEDSCALSLIQRLNIAIDIAHGMAYLHHHCFMQVIHCDLKPNNVLLGEDLTAYIIDFGIAVVCFANSEDAALTSTHVLKGSTGYIPPEYGLGGGVTTKGDVYSYGMVLLEMFTRKKPTHSIFVGGMDLKKWVSNSFPNQVEEVVDGSLLKSSSTSGTDEDKDLKCLTQLIRVGLLCTQQAPQGRPNMMDIVGILQSIKITFLQSTQNANSNQTSYLLGNANSNPISYLLGSTSNTKNNASTTSNNCNSQSSTF